MHSSEYNCVNRNDLKVLVVLGNHEYYNHGRQRHTVQDCLDEAQKICSMASNLVLMNKTSLLINGVRVLGTTLWSKVTPQQYKDISQQLNDYRLIYRDATRALTIEDTCAWFEDEYAWLQQEVAQSIARGEQNTLVLTHHAPAMRGTSDSMYDDSPINSAFCTDLRGIFRNSGRSNVHTWVFGHTHYNTDFMCEGTRVVANQRGYIGYQMCRVIETILWSRCLRRAHSALQLPRGRRWSQRGAQAAASAAASEQALLRELLRSK